MNKNILKKMLIATLLISQFSFNTNVFAMEQEEDPKKNARQKHDLAREEDDSDLGRNKKPRRDEELGIDEQNQGSSLALLPAVDYQNLMQLPDDVLGEIFSKMTNFKDIYRFAITCKRFANIVNNRVQNLSLRFDSWEDRSLKESFLFFRELSGEYVLTLRFFGLTDEILGSIVKIFPNLIDLKIEDCCRVTDKGLAHLVKLVNLQGLKLNISGNLHVSNSGLKHLAKLVNLKSFDLKVHDCESIKSVDLAFLAKLKNLQNLRLNLAGSDRKPNVYLAPLAELVNLQDLQLNLSNTNLTDKCLAPLSSLFNLRSLKLNMSSSGAYSGIFGGHRLTDKCLAPLSRLVNLQNLKLSFYGCIGITGLVFKSFIGLNNLQNLDLIPGGWMDDETLSSLTEIRNLRNLNISYGIEMHSEAVNAVIRDLEAKGANVGISGLPNMLFDW